MEEKVLTEYQFQLLNKIKDGDYLYDNHKRLEGLTTVLVELLSKDTELLYSIIDGYFGDERVINAITDYLNSQDQEEEEKYKKGDRIKLALADKEGWIAGEFEIAEKTNLDWKDGDIMNTVDKEGKLHHFVLRDMMPEDTPEEINPYEKITKEYAGAFAKDEEKGDIKRLREEVKDTPEEWEKKTGEVIESVVAELSVSENMEKVERFFREAPIDYDDKCRLWWDFLDNLLNKKK